MSSENEYDYESDYVSELDDDSASNIDDCDYGSDGESEMDDDSGSNLDDSCSETDAGYRSDDESAPQAYVLGFGDDGFGFYFSDEL